VASGRERPGIVRLLGYFFGFDAGFLGFAAALGAFSLQQAIE
jgi:hypothetical protein